VSAGAARDCIDGFVVDAAGNQQLAVHVRAPAREGAANAAVIALLARDMGVPKSALALKRGARSRYKLIAVTVDAQTFIQWKARQ
jgi:uncharacterized protein YggU (UPF0235/DUF167 family)